MNYTNTLAPLIGLVVVFLLGPANLPGTEERTTLPTLMPDQTTECADSVELTNALKDLTGNYGEAQKARVTLRKAAVKSPKCKAKIVSLIMNAMDKPGLDLRRDPASYYLWREGSRLLGELKAAQALDLLISHIGINDGEWSVSMVHQPALGGIIEMGPIAVPKLSALLRSSDSAARRDAVYCLAYIGGSPALQVLKEALPSETDSCIKRFIQVSIRSLDNERNVLKDNGEWLLGFLCN